MNTLDKAARTPLSEANSDVGRALRTAYQSALDETIPPEMLALLDQLD